MVGRTNYERTPPRCQQCASHQLVAAVTPASIAGKRRPHLRRDRSSRSLECGRPGASDVRRDPPAPTAKEPASTKSRRPRWPRLAHDNRRVARRASPSCVPGNPGRTRSPDASSTAGSMAARRARAHGSGAGPCGCHGPGVVDCRSPASAKHGTVRGENTTHFNEAPGRTRCAGCHRSTDIG